MLKYGNGWKASIPATAICGSFALLVTFVFDRDLWQDIPNESDLRANLISQLEAFGLCLDASQLSVE
jgi:hypothetical protein